MLKFYVLILCIAFFATNNLFAQNYKAKYCAIQYPDGINIYHHPLLHSVDSVYLHKICHRIVSTLANKGYPFANIVADSIVATPKPTIYCTLNTYRKYTIGNIYINSNLHKQSPYYIYSTIGIMPGATYCEKRIANAARLLEASQLISVCMPTDVEFHHNDADIYLCADAQPLNNISAAAALNLDEISRKYYLTGYADAIISNNFGYGESFSLHWNGFAHASQEIDISATYPFVLQTPITPSANLKITKKDTTLLHLRATISSSYAISPYASIKGNVAIIRHIPHTQHSEKSTSTLYGGSIISRNITRWLLSTELKISTGHRTYQSKKHNLTELDAHISTSIPLQAHLRLENKIFTHATISSEYINIYEMYAIGGPQSIRGFSANEFYATKCVIANNTLRLNLTHDYSLSIFYDQCFYQLSTSQLQKSDTPFGTGLSISFRKAKAKIEIGLAIGYIDHAMRSINNAKTFIVTHFEI